MKNISCLCAIVCLLMVSTGPVEAAQFEFVPSLSVGGEFTDNHFLSENNQEEEFITTISPLFSGKVITKLHGLEITYNPTYAAYNNYDENNMLRQMASAKGWLTLGKNTRLEVGDSFSLTEDPLSEADVVGAGVDNPDVAIDTTLRSSRQSHYSNSAKINLSHQFGAADSMTVSYVQSVLENEDPAIEDNERHNPSVAVTFWPVPQRIGLETKISYTKGEFSGVTDDFSQWNPRIRLIRRWTPQFDTFFDYSHTLMDYSGARPDYQIYNPSVGLTWVAAENSKFSADVGYYDSDDPNQEENAGVTANANLSSDFKRGSINLTGSGGYEETYFGAENLGFTMFYEAGFSANVQIDRHVSGNIFGSFKNSKFEETLTDREDDTTRAGAGLTFSPLSWLSLELNYTYRSVDSSTFGNDYSENRLQFNVSFVPAAPYRKSI